MASQLGSYILAQGLDYVENDWCGSCCKYCAPHRVILPLLEMLETNMSHIWSFFYFEIFLYTHLISIVKVEPKSKHSI